MSKEELYNIVFDTPELKEYVENKDKEIERLKSIINEAIEFIYDNAFNLERTYQVDDLWYEIPKLLDILNKGDDNK